MRFSRKITPQALLFLAASLPLVLFGSFARRLKPKSFRTILGEANTLDSESKFPSTPSSDHSEMLAGWSVKVAARILPGDHNCLSQAIAGQFFFAAMGKRSQIVIGARRNEDSPAWDSHAWLTTENGIVVGGELATQFSTIAIYSKSPRTLRDRSRESDHNKSLRTIIDLISDTLVCELIQKKTDRSVKESLLEHGEIELSRHHRISELLARNLDPKKLKPPEREKLLRAIRTDSMPGLRLTRDTVLVSSLFQQAGVNYLILKGVALSLLSGRKAGSRGGGDVDVLVHHQDVPNAHRILVNSGFTPKAAFVPNKGLMWAFWAFRDRELCYRMDGLEVDLHWRVAKNANHAAPTANQLARSQQLPLANSKISTQSPGDALLASAMHVYLDFCQNLRGIVDVVYVANSEGLSLPHDAPASSLQLLSDVLEFAKWLLDPRLIPEIPGLPPASAKGVRFLIKMWQINSSRPLAEAKSSAYSGEFLARLAHSIHYGGSVVEASRFFLKILLDFPDYSDDKKSTGLFGALSHRIAQLLTGKIPHLQARRLSKKT